MKNMKVNIVILICICSLVLFLSLKDDFNTIMSQLYTINFWWFLLACFLMLIYFLFRAFEMHDLIRLVDSDYPFRKSLGIVVIGQFFANITPSSIGAQPAQIYFLNKDKIKPSKGTRVVIQYNASYQMALLFISLITIVLAFNYNLFGDLTSTFAFKELAIASFFIHLVVLLVLLGVNSSKGTNQFLVNKAIKVLSFLRIVKNKEKTLNNWDDHLHEFHDSSSNLFKNRKLLFKGIVTNSLAIISMYSIPIILIYSIGDFESLKFLETIVSSSYTNIISSFIPSPGGTGGFEYFFTVFFGVFVTGATIKTLMLLWRFVTYYFVLVIGSIILFFTKERVVIL